jgi:glycosyltransferase involved in cell wall biosynthesis
MKPRVSVIITHFECEAFVTAAVESVLGQDISDLRVIFVDDYSRSRRWLELLKPYTDDTRLELFRSTSNVGPYRLKNWALGCCRSEFVAFQDADDVSDPSRLRKQIALLEASGAGIVGSSFRYIDASGNVIGYRRMWRNVNFWMRLGKSFGVLHGTMLARRVVLSALGGFDGTTRFGGDTEFLFRASDRVRIKNAAEFLYDYRIRPGSLSASEDTGIGSLARAEYMRSIRQRRIKGDLSRAKSLAGGSDVGFSVERVLP